MSYRIDDSGLLYAPGEMVALPCCGFAMSVDHTDGDSDPATYSCPLCEPRSHSGWMVVPSVRAHDKWIVLAHPDQDYRLAVQIPTQDGLEAGERFEAVPIHPCRGCDWSERCGDPAGSECHS